MDFNIDNKSFGNAYNCLSEANALLQNGLGNFNDLDSSALSLINKDGVSNSEILNGFINECSTLKGKMYNTIMALAEFDVESADYFFDILSDGFLIDYDWDGTELTARMGFNGDGPSGSETWYDLNMSKVVENMEKLYGYTDLVYSIRDDGVKVLSGTTPDGEKFENLVIVAADVYHESANPNGTFQRGQIVETSLGMGIVADYCGRSVSTRKSSGEVHFDIATAWHTGQYMAAAYGENPPVASTEGYEQVVPASSVKSISSGSYNVESSDDILSIVSNDEMVTSSNTLRGKDAILIDGADIKGTFNPDTYVSPSIPVVDADIKSDVFNSDTSLFDNPIDDLTSKNVQPKNNTLIAHRGYHPGGIWENSADAFIAAGESGFWGAEADILFDADGNLVVSHNFDDINSETITMDEYLDICAEYGMTAIIDLKYANGTEVLDTELSKAVLKALDEKGMTDMSVLQTNNAKDVAYIRENSEDARIWYLKDAISDSDMQLIQENDVECVNIKSNSDKNLYRIKNLTENGVDVCVWNVQSEEYKNALINNGATYVMTDYGFDVSPYQEGDKNYNANSSIQNSTPVISLTTDPITTFDDTPKSVVESGDVINSVKKGDDVKSVVSTSKDTSAYYDSIKLINDSTGIVDSVDEQLKNNDVNSNNSGVPLIYQSDYTNVNYGTGTLATHGCGITSLAMVASYYNDTEITPDMLVDGEGEYKYGVYGSASGTGHEIFAATADELNLPLQEQIHYSSEADLNKVVDALSEGSVVIAKAKSNSVFTNSGHYIVLTGVTEDGKITVNDPNKYNYNEYNEWNGKVLTDGFANGFDQEQFKYGKIEEFFIYSPKN